MKTILDQLINDMPKNTLATVETVWNLHSHYSFLELAKNRKSNLSKTLSDKTIFSDEYLKDGVTIFAGKKGRSAHSASDVVIFRGDHLNVGTVRKGEYISFNELVANGLR